MSAAMAICKRELKAYFGTPIAYVFLVIFVMLTGVFTFYVGNFFGRGVADLQPFFTYLPWLYLVLVPAVSMRLWAEERKSGTIELLMTLPVSVWEAVVGKWLAGTIFLGLSLAATFPLWITVNYLGAPDNGVIAASYFGAWVLAAVYLAIGACVSAFTKNQVIAFVLAVALCFVFLTSGTPVVLDAIRAVSPQFAVDAVSALSALTHFEGLSRGVIEGADLVYSVSMIMFWLFANVVVISLRKAD